MKDFFYNLLYFFIEITTSFFTAKKVSIEFYFYIIPFAGLIATIIYLLRKYFTEEEKQRRNLPGRKKKLSFIENIWEQIISLRIESKEVDRNGIKKTEEEKQEETLNKLRLQAKVIGLKLLNKYEITVEGYIAVFVISGLLFSILFSFMLKLNILISLVFFMGIFSAYPFIRISNDYEKRKTIFETAITIIGITMKSDIKNKKSISDILKSLVKLNKKVVSEEFDLVLKELEQSNNVERSLNIISERYPASVHLGTIKDFLVLYYETGKDISKEIHSNVILVENMEEVKKISKVEFAGPVRTSRMLLVFGLASIIILIMLNQQYFKFYTRQKVGITILVLNVICLIIGEFIFEYMQISITRDKPIKRISTKRRVKIDVN